MDLETLNIKVSVDDGNAMTALNALTRAAEEAEAALTRLAGLRHGGIEIAVCGVLATCTIKPAE